jgi:hypothetical protein
MTFAIDCPAPDCRGELQYVTDVFVMARPAVLVVRICDTCRRVWVAVDGEDWREVG